VNSDPLNSKLHLVHANKSNPKPSSIPESVSPPHQTLKIINKAHTLAAELRSPGCDSASSWRALGCNPFETQSYRALRQRCHFKILAQWRAPQAAIPFEIIWRAHRQRSDSARTTAAIRNGAHNGSDPKWRAQRQRSEMARTTAAIRQYCKIIN
jgi:hypothetical protein